MEKPRDSAKGRVQPDPLIDPLNAGDKTIPDGIMVGYRAKAHFNIPKFGSDGIPFPELPNLKAHETSSTPYGGGICLYDSSESSSPSNRPCIEVESKVVEGSRTLTVSVGKSIPKNHLLRKASERVMDHVREFAQNNSLDVVNQFHPDFDNKSLYDVVWSSFNSTANEVLGTSPVVDEEAFYVHHTKLGLGDVKTFDDFKKQGIKFLSRTGLAATTPQKMRFLERWADRLIEKNVFPQSVRKQP